MGTGGKLADPGANTLVTLVNVVIMAVPFGQKEPMGELGWQEDRGDQEHKALSPDLV